MFVAMAFLIGVLIGFGIGFLCYRNNAKNLQEKEKSLIDVAEMFKDLHK